MLSVDDTQPVMDPGASRGGAGGASGAARSGPVRRGATKRERAPAEGMVRFVVDPRGTVVPDVAHKLPGRGIWIEAERAAVERAVTRNLFAREARRPVDVAPDLAGLVEKLLVRRCLDLIGLAKRAGQLTCGFDQVCVALAAGRPGVLLTAADARSDSAKLRRMAGDRAWLAPFDRIEMGAQIGRAELVYAFVEGGGVDGGGLARRLVGEVRRLAGFRTFEWVVPGEGAVSYDRSQQNEEVCERNE